MCHSLFFQGSAVESRAFGLLSKNCCCWYPDLCGVSLYSRSRPLGDIREQRQGQICRVIHILRSEENEIHRGPTKYCQRIKNTSCLFFVFLLQSVCSHDKICNRNTHVAALVQKKLQNKNVYYICL